MFTTKDLLLLIGIVIAILLLFTSFNLFDGFQMAHLHLPLDHLSIELDGLVKVIKMLFIR